MANEMGKGDADSHQNDPDNNDSFVDVIQKTLVNVVTPILFDKVLETSRAVAVGQTGGGVAASAGGDGDGGNGQTVVDGRGTRTEQSDALPVNTLASAVGNLIRAHRPQLEEAVRTLMHYGIDQLRVAIGKLWNMFIDIDFRWFHLVLFVAFCALLIYGHKSGDAAEVGALAMTAAKCVRDWIVTTWKEAFINLGGWLGFCQFCDGDLGKLPAEERARQDTMATIGKAAGCALAFASILYAVYHSYQDFVRIPEPD
eukprot:scpid85740/ scgid30734/ 